MMIRAILLAMMGLAIGTAGCSPTGAAEKKPPRSRSRSFNGQTANAAVSESRSAPSADSDAPAEKKKTETAVFAGGCFWCTEFAFEQIAGVTNVVSGYCGGSKSTANYEEVHLGFTGHAEAIRVTFDPEKVTYNDLLDVFFDAHDPTQLNRQGVDEGPQYRSAIFFADEEQEQQAKAKIADLKTKRVYRRRIVTKLEELKEFYPAEGYHQDFARRNPFVPSIQGHAIPKALRVRLKHPDLIRKEN